MPVLSSRHFPLSSLSICLSLIQRRHLKNTRDIKESLETILKKKRILQLHKSSKLCVRGLEIGTIDNVGGPSYSIKLITLFPLSLFPICVFFTNQNKCPPPISASSFVFLDSPRQHCSSSAVQPALLFTLPEVRQIFKMCVHLSCFLLRLCIYLSFFYISALKLCKFTDLT